MTWNVISVCKCIFIVRRQGTSSRNLGVINFHSLTFPDRVAVKLIDKTKLDAKTQRMLVREIQIMDKLAHPCLIR